MTLRAGHEQLSAVLIDDHEIVLEGLKRALSRESIDVEAGFRTGEEAVHYLQAGDACRSGDRTDLVIVDLRLGGRSGVDLVEEVLAVRPGVQVAMLTSFEDRAAVVAAVRAGARGFFLKDSLCGELASGLRRVADGHLVIDSRLATAVLDTSLVSQFSNNELEILRLVAKGLSNRQIGDSMHLSHYTVKEYLSRSMRKLGTGTRAETVLRAVEGRLLTRES
ncbi:response regulator transcription factor [Pseudonocardia ammonioxydans]|uniref:response regulator transcription factor n=1 Tax=Pseudonocardia ammonioxydans TaxID=260086 RepID=UPI0015A6FAE2|nr:response regulator transcription factor [Pseudonocardia ammonioxydans]